MAVSPLLRQLRLPLIAAPLFLVSGTELVTAACRQGIVGTFPALNARSEDILDQWLSEITTSLAPEPPGKKIFGVNLIVHSTNPRLKGNLDKVVKYKAPVVITSLGAAKDVIQEVHNYGGLVYHDVTNLVHAKKAAAAGVDGLILVCSGAGGHSGATSPFALVPKVREFFKGTVIVAGSISDGRGILAAQALGGDLAYMGTRFIATKESMASPAYKQLLVDTELGPAPSFLPTVYTDKISGVYANFIRASLENAGLNPDRLEGHAVKESFDMVEGQDFKKMAWKDVWSAGHGLMNIHDIPTVQELVQRLETEYQDARKGLLAAN